MDQVKEGKKISVHHFVYMIVIFVIAIIAIISIQHGGSGRAGENLAFAATLASIILAVIAILYTLFDSSSQKKNADSIKKSVRELRGYGEEFKEQISISRQLNSELLNKFVELEEWRKQVKEEIESKTNTAQDTTELKKQVNEILNRTVIPEMDIELNRVRFSMLFRIMRTNEQWTIKDLRHKLMTNYQINFHPHILRRQLDEFVDKGTIVSTMIDNVIYYSINLDK